MALSQGTESYQLKWHSHLTNLNSSVATLYTNDKFADVLLFTSHSDGGNGIPAHKIILSTCSQFFATIFESNQSPPNSMVYIVLPPELSKRSIQTLVQYMYSGEATVSNDILNEVLRGGEFLQIRGLCRNSEEPNACSIPQFITPIRTKPDVGTVSSSHSKDNGQIYVDKYQRRRERFNSSTNIPVLKESPLNVMPLSHPTIQKINTTATIQSTSHHHNLSHAGAAPATPLPSSSSTQLRPLNPVANHSSMHISSGHNLLIKKEIAVDPGEISVLALPATHYTTHGGAISSTSKKTAQTSDKRLNTIQQNGRGAGVGVGSVVSGTEHIVINHHSRPPSRYSNTTRHYGDEHLLQRDMDPIIDERTRDGDILRLSTDKRRTVTEHLRPSNHHHLDPGEKTGPSVTPARFVNRTKQQSDVQVPDAMNFLTIKQEPVEWLDYDLELDKSHIEVTVKPEFVFGDSPSDEEEEEQQELVYSPLTCELCSETFTIPADWVRHIESHAEASHCVPKKRKRIEQLESSSNNTAALRCDLCSMFFVTPAEWVRHVQNTHTETELALSNNSPPKRAHRSPRPIDGPPHDRICSICKKTFPSNASMLIHKRTHTGDQPFSCRICEKNFNVKSNLLRHMRTLHNQILNPSNVTDGPMDDDGDHVETDNCNDDDDE